MDKIVIKGQRQLSGKVKISGAKNAVLPIMTAALMADGKSTIRKVPNLRDTRTMIQLMEIIGAKCSFKNDILVAFVDLDENVFASVGLVSELKRKNLKVIGIMKKVKNRERSKLQSAGCEMIFPKSSVVKNIPKLLDELSF